jgi:hypothetical protein
VALLAAPILSTAVLLALSLFSPEYFPVIVAADELAALLLSSIVSGVVVGLFEELGWTGFASLYLCCGGATISLRLG